MPKHCVKCGDQTDGTFFCSDACADADYRDTSYAPEENEDHGSSTIWDRD